MYVYLCVCVCVCVWIIANLIVQLCSQVWHGTISLKTGHSTLSNTITETRRKHMQLQDKWIHSLKMDPYPL